MSSLIAVTMRRSLPVCLAASFVLAPVTLALTTARSASAALPPTITYTGQLLSGAVPVANGSYDFKFTLYHSVTGGSPVGSTLSVPDVTVANGVFYVELDFGAGVFSGQPLYLQTAYALHPAGVYTTQATRKLIATSGNADYASLSGSTLALQGKGISAAAPTTGQVLTWNGSLWTPAAAGAGAYSAGAGLSLSGTTFSVPAQGIKSAMIGLPLALNAYSSIPILSVNNSNVAATSNHTMEINGGGTAIYGATTVAGGNGVQGVASNGANAYGVYGLSNDGHGVSGVSNTGFGVYGKAATGAGVRGESASSGDYGLLGGVDPIYSLPAGVVGVDASGQGFGVFGSSSGGKAVYGKTQTGDGVVGTSGSGNGLYGSSDSGDGVYGISSSEYGVGVYGSGSFVAVQGVTDTGYAVFGSAPHGNGVVGVSLIYAGVSGSSDSYEGVHGDSHSGDGIYGASDTGYAGYFQGDVNITGALTAGTKDFKIDHPLDPAGKYLSHACIESNEMADLYSGNVTTDAGGDARVTLPDWFQALNKDFRYQLTVIGQFAQAAIAAKIHNNQFAIKTDKPNVEISWQVVGIRQDAFAAAHPLQVEEAKPAQEQGLYLHPKEWNQPEDRGIGYARSQTRQAHRPR